MSNESADNITLESSHGGRLDLIGAILALLCLAHCALLPFLSVLVAVAPWIADEIVHKSLLILVTPIAIFSLYQGFTRHHRQNVLFVGGIGLCLLLAGPFSGEALEKPLTIVGSLVLCSAHLLNRKQLLNG